MPGINLWIPKSRELLLVTVFKHDLYIEQTLVPSLKERMDCLDCRLQSLLENEIQKLREVMVTRILS